jgi:flagellar biosynthesis GTPase FlhF
MVALGIASAASLASAQVAQEPAPNPYSPITEPNLYQSYEKQLREYREAEQRRLEDQRKRQEAQERQRIEDEKRAQASREFQQREEQGRLEEMKRREAYLEEQRKEEEKRRQQEELQKERDRVDYEQCVRRRSVVEPPPKTIPAPPDASATNRRTQSLPGPAATGWYVVIGPPTNLLFEQGDQCDPKIRKAKEEYTGLFRALSVNCLASVVPEADSKNRLVALDPLNGFKVMTRIGPFLDKQVAQQQLISAGWQRGKDPNTFSAQSGCEP